MRSADKVYFVSREMPAMEALETMGREDVNQLPVMSDERVEGIVSRAHVLQVAVTRGAEFASKFAPGRMKMRSPSVKQLHARQSDRERTSLLIYGIQLNAPELEQG